LHGADPAAWLGLLYRWRWALAAVVAAVWIVSFTGAWRVTPDGAHQAYMGRAFFDGRGLAHPLNLGDRITPGLPWLIAGGMQLAGRGALWPTMVVIWATGVVGVVLTWWLMRVSPPGVGRVTDTRDPAPADGPTRARAEPAYDRKVAEAWLVALALGFNRQWLDHALTLMADVPFATAMLGVLLGVGLIGGSQRLRSAKRRLLGAVVLLVVGLAVALVMRTLGVVLLAVVVGWFVCWGARSLGQLRMPRLRWAVPGGLAVAAGLATAVWVGWRWAGADVLLLFDRLVNQGAVRDAAVRLGPKLILETLGEAVFGLDMGHVAGVVGPIALIGTVAGLVRGRGGRWLWLVLLGVVLMQCLVLNATERYLLPVLPMLIWGWWRATVVVTRWIAPPPPAGSSGGASEDAAGAAASPAASPSAQDRRRGWRHGLAVGVFMLGNGLYVVANGVEIGDLLIEQHGNPAMARYDDGEWQGVYELSEWLVAHGKPGDVAVIDRQWHGPALFWTDDAVRFELSLTPETTRALVDPDDTLYLIDPVDPSIETALVGNRWQRGELVYERAGPHGWVWRVWAVDFADVP
jgi:hypothetical protein